MEKINLLSLNLNKLEDLMTYHGQKKFRSKQIFEAIHKKKILNINDITVLSKEFREQLSNEAEIYYPEIVEIFSSKIDSTKKFLLKLKDGQIIETVYMEYEGRNTICVSCQVGCKMACSFCASTKAGFVRHLEVGEILSQVYIVEKELNTTINNIVFMGIGEPLDNYQIIIDVIYMLNHNLGKNMSQRSMTLSTSGLANKIYDLANLNLSINLAVSFHYPFDTERSKFMPVNKKFPIKELLKACDYYFEKTGRRVSFEYVLVDGLNDTNRHIDEIYRIFKGKNIHINLIPLNEIEEFNYNTSNEKNIKNFAKKLNEKGINATLRNKKGSDIDGACGQLRVNYLGEN